MSKRVVEPDPDDEPSEPEATLTARQAAARLRLDERTVRRAISRGQLRAAKRAGAFRITLADLERFRAGRSRADGRPRADRDEPQSAESRLRRESAQVVPIPA